MISFSLFTELEAKRDTINAKFHRETEPQLIERFQQFGFVPRDGEDPHYMSLKEKSTGNLYLLTCSAYEITIMFEHIRTGGGHQDLRDQQLCPERAHHHEHRHCLD